MSTQCRFCGAAVRPNTMFCPSCGQIVVADAPAATASVLPPPFRTTGGGTREPQTVAAPVAPPEPVAPVPLPDLAPPVARPAAVAPPAPVAPAALALRMPQGAEVAIDQVLVLGRNPAGRAADHGGAPIEVADPTRSVSRVHLIVRPSGPGEASAEDAGSGNGTLLERGGARHPLRPRDPIAIHAGDRLILGDVVVEVGTAR
ncbi:MULTISPECIES: zinc ribbon domain-containing protein [Microbacterium]|uniref:FHA domain-containing protein n=1 Tax=Microbacterium wangchenii TaxID=2541726 RepID=A0ABX5SRM7_9MICO|nr:MULTISPECIES: FHA domain-containing protein [Microbacterium]MCK6066606.1 FHA domain-containing protein [Microbacterium sp. EYE_512]QBR87940.1 FHA domain-containing protein [Microbacterium wangchenii]TFV83937.1 FHA domain-containing protein [Microbacterium sp. dk485]TXK18270.1 FHA domain-containing protein [Microbacterium wangchenii]